MTVYACTSKCKDFSILNSCSNISVVIGQFFVSMYIAECLVHVCIKVLPPKNNPYFFNKPTYDLILNLLTDTSATYSIFSYICF